MPTCDKKALQWTFHSNSQNLVLENNITNNCGATHQAINHVLFQVS